MIFPSFGETAGCQFLRAVADACFAFMSVFVACGAATKLGGTPIDSWEATLYRTVTTAGGFRTDCDSDTRRKTRRDFFENA